MVCLGTPSPGPCNIEKLLPVGLHDGIYAVVAQGATPTGTPGPSPSPGPCANPRPSPGPLAAQGATPTGMGLLLPPPIPPMLVGVLDMAQGATPVMPARVRKEGVW